jgi:hypothetical protein
MITIFFLFCFSVISPAQESKVKGPKISVDKPSYDLTEIDEGTPVTHTYVIKNEGDEDLKIEKVQPT